MKYDLTEKTKKRYNRSAAYYDWMDRMVNPKLRKKALSLVGGQGAGGRGRNREKYSLLSGRV